MSDLDLYPDTVTCGRCGCHVKQGRVARYEHDDCEGSGVDPVRQRAAIRLGEARTAELLRRMGHHDRAVIHEERAR